MTRSPKDKAMLTAMGVLVLFAAYNFVIRPQGGKLDALRADRSAVEQQVSDAQLNLQAPPDTSPVSATPGGADLAIPADPAISPLLRQLQAAATDSGMLYSSIAPAAPGENPAGPGGSIQVAITAAGTHDARLDYVQRLLDLERLFVIEQISITVQPDTTEQLQISGRVFTTFESIPAT